MDPAQPIETDTLAHFNQQQPRLPGLQSQLEHLAMANGGPAQTPGQPAIEVPHLGQVQAPHLLQVFEQALIAGQRRIALARRKMPGSAGVAVEPCLGLPAQVERPAHFGAILQRTAQGIGPRRQGHTLALQAQPTVQSNGNVGHCRSTSFGAASIYRSWLWKKQI